MCLLDPESGWRSEADRAGESFQGVPGQGVSSGAIHEVRVPREGGRDPGFQKAGDGGISKAMKPTLPTEMSPFVPSERSSDFFRPFINFRSLETKLFDSFFFFFASFLVAVTEERIFLIRFCTVCHQDKILNLSLG